HAGSRVEHAVNQQGSGSIKRVDPRAKEVGLESPGDPELIEVVLRDLVGGGVAVAREVAAVGRPSDRRPSRNVWPAGTTALRSRIRAAEVEDEEGDSRGRENACQSEESH